MTNDKFDDFITKSKAQAAEFDWAKELTEWLAYLESFYKSVEDFLHPYTSTQKIELSYGEKTISEGEIGNYKVKTAQIIIGKNQIKLDPIGTNLIGAKGRVDMTGPNGKIIFVLVNEHSSGPQISVKVWIQGEEPPEKEITPEVTSWTWRIATPPPRMKYFPFTQESFLDSLMEVSND